MLFHAKKESRAATTLFVVGAIGVLSIIIGTLSSYALMQGRYGRALSTREVALNIAESGLEHYRWYLAHNTAVMEGGAAPLSPSVYTVEDPEGGTLGEASVTASVQSECGVPQWIDITARGAADADPIFARTLTARYMRPSTAEYSYIVNTDVWAGASRVVRGPYHSNGGVRMDATHNSHVSSSVSTWNCTGSYGCSPTQAQAPGVVGGGNNPSLWSYPVSSITEPFSASGVDFANLKTLASTQGGIYYGPAITNQNQTSGNGAQSPNRRGYQVTFLSNGTIDINRVQNASYHQSAQGSEHSNMGGNNNKTFIGNFAIPVSCSLLFFEDRVWVEGVVSGKVTLVAATPADSATSPDVFLNNNLAYATGSETDGVTIIAEHDVSIPYDVPEDLTLHGIFIASSGRYGRNHYSQNGQDKKLRDTLSTTGTVVSNGRTGTAWLSNGQIVSGFVTRLDYYDQQLAFSPPPFTPAVSDDYRFVLWREE